MKQIKSEIRNRVLSARRRLTESEIREKSARIRISLDMLQRFREAEVILCYMDFRNEVMTSDIIESCLKQGKRVAVPCCIRTPENECMLSIHEIRDLSKDICPGAYGILEPDREKVPELSPLEVDMVLVPGVAFDACGCRVGYGAGYYDRFMQGLKPDCFKVGLAFELQIVECIPSEPHDIRLDAIITENRIIMRHPVIF